MTQEFPMSSQPETDHPLSLALRDIAYGLAMSGRWDDFAFKQRQQVFLHGKSAKADPWWIWGVGVQYKKSQASAENARLLTRTTEAALEHLGFRICRLDRFVSDTTIIAPPVAELSAHMRMEILGRIAPLLCECEETVREMP